MSFFKYTKLNHEQQLLNQAITYFKNDPQNYAYLEKKNNELYKLKQAFKQAKYPPEIFKILSNAIDAREAEL